MKAQEIRRNMKHNFIWISAVLTLIGLLGLASISLAVEDTWAMKANMPTARIFLSTSVVNGKIYVIGGIAQANWKPIWAVEEYDPATDTWTRKADMPKAGMHLSTSAVDGKIYAIGGSVIVYPWAPVSTVEEYDTGFVPSIMNVDSSIMSVDVTGKLTATWGKIK